MTSRDDAGAPTGLEIAVVGMAGRFPGAAGVDELWANVAAGVESIRRFSDDELDAAGVPAELRAQPGYVPAGGVLDGIEEMDARFFGYGPREAEILDPQHRLFLEWSWQALEDAGIDPRRFARPVGVWGGTDVNTYLLFHLLGNPELARLVGAQQLRHANRPDTLTTRVAYALDLTGPAVTVQTTCSTGLVAVHLACQSLLNGECDLALAGGVSVDVGQRGGYLAREGGVLSPDGHVRAFDAEAAGMVSGNGGGVVALARLEDALDEGHRVLAVIKGSAINNDGARKVSYSAPGLEGQARVVRAAQVVAGVEPDTIGYVEAHGTGTRLGDPIEVAALTRAFRAGTDRRGFCALGSVKTNIGHLDAGAGVAGLIKAVQALRHRRIPPSLHFRRPNPEIDLAASPFYVAAEGAEWPADGAPRRAGVSSLGIGGTNAHVVLEEAPPPPPSAPSRPRQLLVVSARSAAALGAALTRLGDHLRGPAEPPLADAAWTLATGRRAFAHRAAVVAADAAEAARVARGEGEAAARRIAGQAPEDGVREVAFLLPGQGAQHPGMGAGLYRREAVFRAEVDRCAEALRPHLDGLDLRRLLFPDAGEEETAARELARTRFTQPALFAVEYALARQWASWGVEPAAMLGHSLGEYVAACLAGVFSLPDALALVAARGRMMEALPPGSMLSVPLSEEELAPHLGDELALAAVNAPGLATVSGPPAAVESLAARLEAEGLEVRRLHTSHAFHSAMMDPILDAFAERVSRVALAAPRRPYLSNLTGTWATAAEATDPAAWARHLRSTVRFGHGAAELLASGDRVLLEVGPGRTLASLVRRQARPEPARGGGPPRVVVSMRHPTEEGDDQEVLLGALGRLWCAGVAVDWDGYFAAETRRRVGLPTYPFERRRYWVEAPGRAAAGAAAASDHGEQAPGGAGTPAQPAAISLHERPELSTVYAEPRSEVERAVAGVWERLLGIGGVGAFDDFFELGGHSLLATQVLSRVRDAFHVELPLKALFDAPTVAGLAAAVDAARAAAGAAGSLDVPPPLVPVERSGDLPLSFAQQRLWFLSRLDPGGDAYNVPVAVRLSGDLDVVALERTFAAIVARHEVLRTTFAERDGEPVQVVSPPPARPAPLPRVDLTALPEDARRAAVERHARAEAHRPFDLAAGPLLRVTLLAEAPREHVALVVMHHIVTDGWSMGLLVREIGELYTAFVTGRDPVLPALPVQYADYAAWQRRWLAGEVLERKVAWWRETLGEDPPPAELAVDRPRTAARTWAGGSVGFTFAPETAERLARFGRDSGATVFMTLLAAWAGLLSRATGQEDVRIGTPVAGRNRSEVESLIGFFVNTLVLRADLSGGPSFAALVARVREASLAAHEHQDVPFERLVEELVRERNLAVTPLFQVFFVVQNAPGGRLELPQLTLAALPAESRSAKFDLSLQVEERTRGLTATLEYAADLFDAETAERMAGHLQRLLDAALAEPDRPLAELPLATAAERRQLVAGWNDTAAPVPPGSLHALVERRAAAAPRAPAVVAGDVVWSYADLDRRAAGVAARLAAAGVGREDRVALLAERSPEALAGLLGTLKAGAAFVAVDPGTPAERLAFLLADSGAAAVLSAERLRPRVEGLGVPVVGLEDTDAAAEPRSAHSFEVPAEAAAWVVYTSGSTGVPKGVVVPHGAAVNHAAAVAARYRLTPDDRVLHFASLAFDAALEELFPTWHAGAAVVLRSDEAALDLRVLERQVEREGVTVLNLPTAYWHEWAAELDAAGTAPPAGVRLVVVGTEAALPERWAAWRRRAGEVEWINAYGPSEATVTATVWPAVPAPGGAADTAPVPVRMPIGQPLANVRAHVVDPALAPVPVGLPGELLLGGAGLARGYLGRPGLTAARFVPDPFAAELGDPPGGRLYRTGDRVRRLPDGDLEFLGRLDQQVKLRGFRIEPGEVEAALAELPEVREAAVVVDEPAPGDRRLVACLVAAGPEADAGADGGAEGRREARTAAVREALARRLPPPMVPAAFAWLDRLPRTAGGKADRRALAAVAAEAAGARRRAEPVPPRNELETKLVAIWREVLGGGEIGVHDNFFEIGGHSLKATQLVARVRRDLGVDLPLRQVFERPTVAGLAAAVEAADAAPARDAAAIRDALARLDRLSDEEARALLAEMAAAGEREAGAMGR